MTPVVILFTKRHYSLLALQRYLPTATFPPAFKRFISGRSAAFFTQQSAKIHREAISSDSWQYQQWQIVDFS
eukprot:157533-Ditylum_brightwellii.AAC.1